MKSTITSLYDYRQSVIPEELCRWRVPDEEIAGRLEVLSRNHAREEDAEEVRPGDSVACRSESGAERWNRAVLLLYPGRGLCAPELENACVGARPGEERTVTVDGSEVKLTVTRIVRRSDMPVGDELVRAENIPGVETVEEYCRWYRESNEPVNRENSAKRAAYFLIEEVAAKSEFSIDQEEKEAFVWDRVNALYNALVDAGVDPTIPQEGFDFLTVEQAKANMYSQNEPFFTEYVAQAYLAEALTGRAIDDILREGLEKAAEESGMPGEEILRRSGKALVYGNIAFSAALEALSGYTERFLEE